MNEQSKSARRRFNDGAFHSRYFVGDGIDIGAGNDSLENFKEEFRLLGNVRAWDVADGDAQYLQGVPDNSLDFVHSSHCLEHMADVSVALQNWIRVTKPGGYLIITIPDEDMYEQGVWPSTYNPDHKHTFTIYKQASWSPVSINVLDLIKAHSQLISVERLQEVRDFYSISGSRRDQTLKPNPECAIELICRKR